MGEELLTIGGVADRTGLATSALRYYEREGLISSTRSDGAQRRYDRDVLRRLAFIRVAQTVGLGLDEIRAALAGNLCRCGTQNRIVRAVQRAAREMKT
mgnify:CR=1 FL=1